MKNNHLKAPLFDALTYYAKGDALPFDVPGHKMGKGMDTRLRAHWGDEVFKYDVNSMKELDSLSNPISVIKEAEALAADLFEADHAFFLVNGSTSGVQKMILSVCSDNDKIIMPRNMHKSAYNAVILSGAHPIYLEPIIDDKTGISMGVTSESVIKTIDENHDAKAILLLYPNYFGYTSNIQPVIEHAHKKGLAVLVDQSHGSHFSMHIDLPVSAVHYGADLVTISMHKTGGSLTQSSILLHNNGIVPYSKVRSTINIFQTSSASYLLLGSLDVARSNLAVNGPKLFPEMMHLAEHAKRKINQIDGFSILGHERLDNDGIYAHDITKLTIDISRFGMSGFKVYDLFKSLYNIQLELGETHVILAIISLGDDDQSIERLITACQDFSNRYPKTQKDTIDCMLFKIPKMEMTPRQAFFQPSMLIELEKSAGYIAADSIMVYPPGIPLVVPGEKITEDIIKSYTYLSAENNVLIGSHEKNESLYVKVLVPKEVL